MTEVLIYQIKGLLSRSLNCFENIWLKECPPLTVHVSSCRLYPSEQLFQLFRHCPVSVVSFFACLYGEFPYNLGPNSE